MTPPVPFVELRADVCGGSREMEEVARLAWDAALCEAAAALVEASVDFPQVAAKALMVAVQMKISALHSWALTEKTQELKTEDRREEGERKHG